MIKFFVKKKEKVYDKWAVFILSTLVVAVGIGNEFFKGTNALFENVVGSLAIASYSCDYDVIVNKINNGEDVRISYDVCGAKGDGVTNDSDAIILAHNVANKLYVNKGIMKTVYSCNDGDCSQKNYYIGKSSSSIKVITNVDWKKANFIIDDYVDSDGDGVNDVNSKAALFDVTTPLRVYGNLNNTSLVSLKYKDSVISKLSSSKLINPNTDNLKDLVDELYSGNVNVYNKNIEKFFKSSQRWIIYVTNGNKQFIRKGNNQDSGYNQQEMIIIDSKTGDVLTDINWTYDNITEIKVYPVPDIQISIGNGNFTTLTDNVVYKVGSDGYESSTGYSQRNIYVGYSGNVKLNNIHHYLNESAHPNSNKYQDISNGNMYYGFVKIHNSSYVYVNNVYLTSHSYAKKVINHSISNSTINGTYDLTMDNSVNIFLDNVNYSCNVYEDDGVTKDYNSCYKDKMINEKKWGIMGSSNTKNVFITNSKLNRIDSHRGVTNLYVADTTVGVAAGLSSLTLIGSSNFYGSNLKIDSANNVLKLRDDYGSTWNGTMVFDNLNFIVNKNSTTPSIIYSKNDENWDFGYKSYFPNIYINGLNIDTTTKSATNVSGVSLLDLSTLYSGGSTIDKTNAQNLYYFKDNIYLDDVTYKNSSDVAYTPSWTFNLFSNNFINSSVNTLNKDNYGGSNVVNMYLDSNLSINSKVNTSSNTKFKVVSSMNDLSSSVNDFFVKLKSVSTVPKSLVPVIGNITLSNGKINENIDKNITNYTATIDASNVTIGLETAYIGTYASWESKTFNLNYGTNIINFTITNSNNVSTNYTLTITRPYNFSTNVSDYYYDKTNNYLYTNTNRSNTTILDKLNITDANASIESNKLVIKNDKDEELAKINIVNFSINYDREDKNIKLIENVDYDTFISKMYCNGITPKVFDLKNNEIKTGNILNGYTLKIYNGDKLLDTYNIEVNITEEDYKFSFNKYDYNEENNYLYVGSEKDNDIILSNVVVSNGLSKKIEDNKLIISLGEKTIKEINVITISSNSYDLSKDYIYVGEEIFDVSKIIFINCESSLIDNKLQFKYNDVVVDEFDILSLNLSNLFVSNNVITLTDYISYDDFINNITLTEGLAFEVWNALEKIDSGNITDGMVLKIKYNEEVIDSYNIVIYKLSFNDDIFVDENNGIIRFKKHKHTIEEFLTNVSVFGNAKVFVTDANNNEKSNTTLLTTGDKLVIYLGSQKIEEYLIAIRGDANGDGRVSLLDLSHVRKHIAGVIDETTGQKYEMKGIYFEAIDITDDGRISLIDLSNLRKMIVGDDIDEKD